MCSRPTLLTTEIYNLATNTFTAGASIPYSGGGGGIRSACGQFVPTLNKVILAGGILESGTSLSDVFLYDVAGDLWATLPNMNFGNAVVKTQKLGKTQP